MKRTLSVLILLFIAQSTVLFSQNKGIDPKSKDSIKTTRKDAIKKEQLSNLPKYTDYKIITLQNDTTFIDTTLTIQKHYKNNFLRKDNFELLPFHNIGQPFNNLAYQFSDISTTPDIGYRAKQFFYLDTNDVVYYDVPTPTSEVMFLTALEQGQFLESFFTVNFSRRMNVSIGYRGLRSLGKYRRSLISQGNFRTTFRYETKEGQYTFKGHVITQDLTSEESGGLTATALESFLSDDPNFTDRARLDVNLTGTENEFNAARLYFEHDYKLLGSTSVNNQKDFTNLKIGHAFNSEGKSYAFKQTGTDTNFFGTSDFSGTVNNTARTGFLNNQFFLEFNSKYILGRVKAKVDLMRYSYGYGSIINQNSGITTRKLEGTGAAFGAEWKAKVKNFYLDAEGQFTPGNGRLSGSNLAGKLSYKKDSLFSIKANLTINSKSPNFNFLLHQSVYDQYNWQNNFDNIRTQDVGFLFDSKWINTSVNFTNIQNYTYFGEDNLPYQSSESITYLKVKASREFTYGKFALDNTLMYQNVSSGSSIFRVPQFVTRNTLYYTDYWFKGKPMKVQIGATFKYFTKYKANAYNPLLAEFTLQNTDDIGFPTVDIFFNAEIRRTRIYFRLDNFSSNFFGRNYFSAPNYPYRDSVIRFGLVWNWFI